MNVTSMTSTVNTNTHTITICAVIKSQSKRKMPVQRLTVQ